MALALGPEAPFAAGGFCGASALSPTFGLVQLWTASDAAGEWSVAAEVPAGLDLTVHVQAFAAGTCPLACSSAVASHALR